jgi:antitoxin PrlF
MSFFMSLRLSSLADIAASASPLASASPSPYNEVRKPNKSKEMPSAKLTSKGQITVPKEVRRTLGLRTGDRLAFRVRDDGTVVVEAETVDLLSLRGAVRSKVKGVSVEAMKEIVRRSVGHG